MPFMLNDCGFLDDHKDEVSGLERLAVDLRQIASGDGLSQRELAEAHPLGHSQAGMISYLHLMGVVHRHPPLRGPDNGTPQLWALALNREWALRTSRPIDGVGHEERQTP